MPEREVGARRTETLKVALEYLAVPALGSAALAWILWRTIRADSRSAATLGASVAALATWSTLRARRAARPREVTASAERQEPYENGQELVMSFRRQAFKWSSAHIPGSELAKWERRADAADSKFSLGMGIPEFEAAVQDLTALPDWVDPALLDEGCRFFVQTWPFVFYGFSWAVSGGFGSESASAVLLQSRYWASMGEEGRRDTWLRLRETACWLFDMAAHGGESFKPQGVAWKACIHVRYLHCRTRATIRKAGSWDAATHGEPINQAQVIGTLLGSSTLLLQGMEELAGRTLPSRKKDAFCHLWRVIGFLFGIEEELNPNRSFEHSKIVMESLFSFGIKEFPNPELTGVLAKHMLDSVVQGLREDFHVPATPGMSAVAAWKFLGPHYAAAIGLPEPRTSEWLLGMGRMCVFRVFLLLYFLPGAPSVFEPMMRRLFVVMVRSIRKDQPNCRFGAVTEGCPYSAAR